MDNVNVCRAFIWSVCGCRHCGRFVKKYREKPKYLKEKKVVTTDESTGFLNYSGGVPEFPFKSMSMSIDVNTFFTFFYYFYKNAFFNVFLFF